MKSLQNNNENEISAVIVIPRNTKFYDYYINGTSDVHTMKRYAMLKFCSDLCGNETISIRKCIYELHPFVIYPQTKQFIELKENDPPKVSKKDLLFPNAKKIKSFQQNDKSVFAKTLYNKDALL